MQSANVRRAWEAEQNRDDFILIIINFYKIIMDPEEPAAGSTARGDRQSQFSGYKPSL
jgi:hypothetical protein